MKYLLTTLLLLNVFFISCNKSKDSACDVVICQNGANCQDGTCICPDGYEGTYCERLSAERFVGLYEGVLKSTNGSLIYKTGQYIIGKTAKDNVIYISQMSNDHDDFKDIYCEIKNKTELTVLPEKVYRSVWGTFDTSVEGAGSIDEFGRDLVLSIKMKQVSFDPIDSTKGEFPFDIVLNLKKI